MHAPRAPRPGPPARAFPRCGQAAVGGVRRTSWSSRVLLLAVAPSPGAARRCAEHGGSQIAGGGRARRAARLGGWSMLRAPTASCRRPTV